MNIKMVINSQLPTIEPEKQTKQISRTETKSWIIWRNISCEGMGEIGGKGARNRQGDVRTVEEMEKPKNLYA